MWRCSADKPEPKGPGLIFQLRRDVAATLIRVASDIRSGNTAAAAAELEATAALLDNRYSPKVKGPPILKPGGYIPMPLAASLPPPLDPYILAGEEDLQKGQLIKKGLRRDLLTDKKNRVSSNGDKVSDELTQELNLGEKDGNDVPAVPDLLKGLSSDSEKSIPITERNSQTKSTVTEATLDDIPEDVMAEERSGHPPKEVDLNTALKTLYQGYPNDFINMLPGEAELEDLGDEPLPPVASQVTVLLDGCGSSPAYTVAVVRQVIALWPGITILVGVDEEKRAEVDDISHRTGVTVMTVPCEKWRRVDVSLMLGSISTPFTLYLDGISAVTDDLNLVRLLSILIGLKSLGVGVVGGSERGRDGHWDYTCTRVTIDNFRLTMRDGYEYSRAACLYCDVTSSSFLAATKVLREVPFDLNMPYRGQMTDWGLQLQRRGVLTMTCPDVMFHIQKSLRPRDQHREVDRSCVTKEDRKQARAITWAMKRQYRRLAQKWEINYVTFKNGTSFEYNCREIRYDCNAYHNVRHYLLPPCCLKMKNKMFNTVDIIAKENHVPFEISSGTLLGALKFKDGLPWDFDDDAYYRNSDVEVFIRNKHRMRRLGLSPYFSDQVNKFNSSIISKYIYSTAHGGFFMDLWGLNKMASEGTSEALNKYPDNLVCLQHGHFPMAIKTAKSSLLNTTRNVKIKKKSDSDCFLSSIIRVGTNWLTGPWNPGRKALTHYGDNLFRHQGHWRWTSVEHPGWPKCPRPGHHACLDLHPMDGSLPFL